MLHDAAWRSLFGSGTLAENPAIEIAVDTRSRLRVKREDFDQTGRPRPAGVQGDIGAIERP